jgi:organic hydroperoxide reductase OsmC/OhrA
VARIGKLPWISLDCEVEGLLERADGTTRFTAFDIVAQLVVPAGTDADAALHALKRAEHSCLISNSLSGRRTLSATVDVAA